MQDRFTFLSAASGLLACLIGLTYLHLAGAPISMIMLNGGALIIGLLLAIGITSSLRTTNRALVMIALASSLVLLATSVFGYAIADARRWILLGPFFIQPSSILLPLVVIAFAKVQNPWTTLAVIISALAMAGQPDRAMAGMLCFTILIIGWLRANKWTAAAAVIGTMTFATTLLLPDKLTAVPYVDHIVWTAFEINMAIGLALWFGCFLIICPILILKRSERKIEHYAFASCWLALIAAAAMGAYPTPLVGYGSSAIIGYFLSLALVHMKHELAGANEPRNPHRTKDQETQFKINTMAGAATTTA